MPHALLDLLRYAMDQQTYAGIPDSRPSQRNNAKDGAPHCVPDASQFKGWASMAGKRKEQTRAAGALSC